MVIILFLKLNIFFVFKLVPTKKRKNFSSIVSWEVGNFNAFWQTWRLIKGFTNVQICICTCLCIQKKKIKIYNIIFGKELPIKFEMSIYYVYIFHIRINLIVLTWWQHSCNPLDKNSTCNFAALRRTHDRWPCTSQPPVHSRQRSRKSQDQRRTELGREMRTRTESQLCLYTINDTKFNKRQRKEFMFENICEKRN